MDTLVLWGYADNLVTRKYEDLSPSEVDTLLFTEDSAGHLECTAEGGFPNPTFRISYGGKMIATTGFTTTTQIKNGTMAGQPGMRTVSGLRGQRS